MSHPPPRAATPSSSFCPAVTRTAPPTYNRDIDEELLKRAKADTLLVQRAAAREKRKSTCFATVTDNAASTAQWKANAGARADHDNQRMHRYLHSFVPVGTAHPMNVEAQKSVLAKEQNPIEPSSSSSLLTGNTRGVNVSSSSSTASYRHPPTTLKSRFLSGGSNTYSISYHDDTNMTDPSMAYHHANIKVASPSKKVVITQNEPALRQIFREAEQKREAVQMNSNNNNNNSMIHNISNISSSNNAKQQQQHNRPGSSASSNNNNNSITKDVTANINNYISTSEREDGEYLENELDNFEFKLARLRRETKLRDDEEKQRHQKGNANNNNEQNMIRKKMSELSNKNNNRSSSSSSGGRTRIMMTSSQQQRTHGDGGGHKGGSASVFALPKVLQMLFRLLLSRKLSATAALRSVGFPELRSRLSAAAEGGMLKRHAFEAIFLECLRTDQERLEHAAVVDCFLLDAGGDAELAFVLIALQVLLGIASAADVMRYCFYLLDTSSRVPRYLTRLELEALLREADAAAANNPASKDDAEYQSMRSAVLLILDPRSELFDGKGRMPLSGFLDRLRMAMNELNQKQSSSSSSTNSKKGGNDHDGDTNNLLFSSSASLAPNIPQRTNAGVVVDADKTISLEVRAHKKRQQQKQQLDGLASRHDLFHHSTSRRIVLQTAPDELVKES